METNEKKDVKLKVREALQEEAYKGIVRIDSQTMRDIGVRPGDIVEIEGQRKTVGIVDRAYPTDVGSPVIRMDGILRRNAKTGLGDYVKVRRADVKEAKSITIAPAQQGVTVQADPTFFKRGLLGRAVVKGDQVALGGTRRRRSTMSGSPFEEIFDIFEHDVGFGFGSSLRFLVVNVSPSQPVIVGENTLVKVNSKSVDLVEDKIVEVTYEDIGGLTDEVKKIREMVELPLKHPELFERLGIQPPKGVLLHGPPGTGKTLLAKAVANETNSHFIHLDAPQVMCVDGNTEILVNPAGKKTISEIFDEAEKSGEVVLEDKVKKVVKPKDEIKVFAMDDNFNIVTDKVKSVLKMSADETYEIKTDKKGEFKTSKNQPFATLDVFGKVVWKRAEDLMPGDFVAIASETRSDRNFKNEDTEMIPNIFGLLKNLIDKLKVSYEDIDESEAERYFLGMDRLTLRKAKELFGKFKKIYGSKNEKLEEAEKNIFLLEKIVSGDIRWDIVRSVKRGGSAVLYDFSMETYGNFLGGNPLTVLHNSKYVGEAERKIREIFEEAEKNSPAIIFIDEIDAVASKREEAYGEVERRVVAQLLATMDGLKSRGKVVVIAATNRPNSIDPALRRPGRFDREVEIGVPKQDGRLQILKIHTRNMPLTEDVDLDELARVTHGFVGADLEALCKEAAMVVLRRLLPEIRFKKDMPISQDILEKLFITQDDFKEGLKLVRPSAMREVLVEAPSTKWEDIGGLESLKQELKEAVEWPLKYPGIFKRLGVRAPRGILLYGPPGTGKTLLAKAVANESESNFILVKGAELLNKWVGESERGVKKIFQKARQAAPTVIFFDEVDALAPRRGMSSDSNVTERVVNQLLTEVDGLEELNDVVVIGATNRPDILDPALLRSGRFDRVIRAHVPDRNSRVKIFEIHTKDMPLAKDVDLHVLAERAVNYVGADIEGVCREAAVIALRESMEAKEVAMKHFDKAFEKVRPSITEEAIKKYEEIEEQYISTARSGEIRSKDTNYFG